MFETIALVVGVLTMVRLLMPSYAEEAGIWKFRLLMCGIGLVIFMISGAQYDEAGDPVASYGVKLVAAVFFLVNLFTFRFFRKGLTASCLIVSILLFFCFFFFVIIAVGMLVAFLIPLSCIFGAVIWLVAFFALFGGEKPEEYRPTQRPAEKKTKTPSPPEQRRETPRKPRKRKKEEDRTTQARDSHPSVADLIAEEHRQEHLKNAKDPEKKKKVRQEEKRSIVQALSLWGDQGHRSYDPTGGVRMVGRADYLAMCTDGAVSDLIQFSLKSSSDGRTWMLSPSPGKNRVLINGQAVAGMTFLAPGMVVELLPEGAESGVARLVVKGEMRIRTTPTSSTDA